MVAGMNSGELTRDALRWAAVDSGGWQYFTGALPAKRLLCYDSGTEAVPLLLAGQCRELVVLHPDPARRRKIQDQAAAMGYTNLTLRAPEALYQDQAAEGFDGFVLHDPQARFLHRGNRAALAALLAALPRLLRPGAFVYFGVRHLYGYDRLLAWLRVRRNGATRTSPWSARDLARRLRTLGVENLVCIPMLLEHERVSEAVPARGYLSVKNRFLPSERLKELVLGRFGARWLAPFYGLVAFSAGGGSSFLDDLLQYLRTQAIDGVSPTAELSLKRYFVLNGGKVILSLGPRGARQGSLIVILTHDAISAQRRELEAKVLSDLAQLPAALSSRIPRMLHRTRLHGVHCFVLSELPGVTVDAPTAELGRLTRNAAGFLGALHIATREIRRITASSYPALIGAMFQAANERYPALAAPLAALETQLRHALLDRELPLVRLHGDYKLENVMVDENTGEVTGVIDWELSQPLGPPLIDLIYLFVYNRMVHGEDWFSAFQSSGPLGRREREEQAMLDQYQQDVPLAPESIPALYVLFFIHHIGYRLHFDLSEPGRKQEMHDRIQILESYLQKQGRGSGTAGLPEKKGTA
jgi:aminoglycoside phosphotransferase (APT) family kinase protein